MAVIPERKNCIELIEYSSAKFKVRSNLRISRKIDHL